ncbi:MAG: FGGY-family carbohydrate kinase [Jatrophihabitans sp.]
MPDLLLGLDIGTSSSKAVLTRPDGTLVAQAVRAHETSMPRPGFVEHDAEQIWLGDLTALVAELAPQLRDGVAAIGLSGIGPCLLVADAAGRPLRPGILYGVDTRAVAEIHELTERYGREEILRRCGSVLTTQAVGPKIAWVRAHEPEVWASTRQLFTASSYLVHELTGEYVLDHHTASQWTPLYDTRDNSWIEAWAADIAPGVALPRLAWPGEVAGTVTAEAARRLGLPSGTPVLAGTVDAWAEAYSVGVNAAGDVMVMYGTTMFLVQVLAQRGTWPTLWGTVGVRPGSYTLAAGMATSGSVTDWLRAITGESSYAALVDDAAATPCGADGLVLLPYFAGERTPLFDPDARGVIAGLTLGHTRGHLYRAALEGIACGVRHNLETMADAGGQLRRLVAVGGGTQGRLWTQIVSDVLQQPQDVPTYTIGACYGDALLAAQAVGLAGDEHNWNPVARVVEPDDGVAETYGRLYCRYRELYSTTADLVHDLAADTRI